MLGNQGSQGNLAFIDQPDGIQVVLVAVHHGGVQVQLVIVENREIYLGHGGEHRHQDNSAALSGIFNRLPHGDVVAGAVVNHVGFVWAEVFQHSVAKVGIFRINTVIRPALLGFCQANVADVGDYNALGSHALGRLGNQNSNRSGAKNSNFQAGNVSRLPDGVNGDS